MTNTKATPQEVPDPEPVETESSALVRQEFVSAPLEMTLLAEQAAELATRFNAAVWKICASCTFPEDWHIFGSGADAQACLSSSGAERIARHFPIQFEDAAFNKETWKDSKGEGYRYIYTGYAVMPPRRYFIQGQYSSREPFVGVVKGELRPVEDVNETNVRQAAYHIFRGAGIKSLLGLRGGVPVERFKSLMGQTGQDAGKTKAHDYAKGSEGGTSEKDVEARQELSEIILALAGANMLVVFEDEKGHSLVELDPELTGPEYTKEQHCREICVNLSSFWSKKDKKRVIGKSIRELSGKWLGSTLKTARDMAKQLQGAGNGN